MDRQERIAEFRKNGSEILGDSSKTDRVEKVEELGLLDRRRTLLSPHPEARARLALLEKTYNDLKTEYPEFFGLTLYGSHTKGYANGKSDFDGHVFVDVEKAFASLDVNKLNKKDFFTRDELREIYLSQPRAFDEQAKNDHAFSQALMMKYNRALNNFLVQNGINNAVGERKLELVFLDQDYVRRCATSDEEMDYYSEPIVTLFNISLDREINRYREIVISEMEAEGEKGKKKWKKIMEALGFIERLEKDDVEVISPETNPERHARLYPSLDKARAYFLQGS